MVDIYVTTYNRAELLEKTLKSILKQTYSDFKLTVLDNCSTDNTREIVESFTDPRIIYHRHAENLGSLGNINFALTASANKYFVVFHDDDIMLPDMLEKEVEMLDKYPDICAVSCRTKKIHMDFDVSDTRPATVSETKLTKYRGKSFVEDYINFRTVMMFPTIMYRTDFLREHNIKLKPEAGPSCDVLICMDLERAGGTLGIIEEQFACYRTHEGQDSQQSRVDMVKLLFSYLCHDEYYSKILAENRRGQNRTYRKLLFNETCLYAAKKISITEWKKDMDSYKSVLSITPITKCCYLLIAGVSRIFPAIIPKIYAVLKNNGETVNGK